MLPIKDNEVIFGFFLSQFLSVDVPYSITCFNQFGRFHYDNGESLVIFIGGYQGYKTVHFLGVYRSVVLNECYFLLLFRSCTCFFIHYRECERTVDSFLLRYSFKLLCLFHLVFGFINYFLLCCYYSFVSVTFYKAVQFFLFLLKDLCQFFYVTHNCVI